MEQVY